MITGEAAIVGDIKEKKDAMEFLIKKHVPEGGYIELTEEMVENHKSKLNRKTAVIKIKINEIIGKERPQSNCRLGEYESVYTICSQTIISACICHCKK